MSLQLGDMAPNFQANTTMGEVSFHEWLGDSWGILFSHPKDFTPVCTTELGEVSRLKEKFDKRNIKAMALSVDSVSDHQKWIADIEETQKVKMNFPIIGDESSEVASLYGMIHPKANDTLTVRSVFIIDAQKKIRLVLTYPASTGRNFDEILRTVDSLQLTDNYQVATPANWKEGDDCLVVPSVSTSDAKEKFPKGVLEVRPYLRVTPQPNI